MEAFFVRTPLIAGNWKCNGSKSRIHTLMEQLKAGIQERVKLFSAIEVLVCPSFVYLDLVKTEIANTPIQLGAQNLYVQAEGAFTGEVSGPMLVDIGCRYVLIGHSERRTLFYEDLACVAAKFKAALEARLIPILCIGETRLEREAGKTEEVLQQQLESVIHFVGIENLSKAVIAYEPVWAIGTGLTATPEEAQQAHSFIRSLIAQNNVDLAKTIRILYGGSMNAKNAQALLSMPDIDGGLIGGASLDATSFLTICDAAKNKEVLV